LSAGHFDIVFDKLNHKNNNGLFTVQQERYEMSGKTNLLLVIAVLSFTVSAQHAEVPLVEVEKAVMAENEVPRKYSGSIVAVESTDIVPRVTGTLLKTHFKEGDSVKKGALLYELENTTYVARVDGLKAQKKALEAALVFADKEFRRSDTMLKSKASSVADHDRALFEIDAAKAKIKEIEASLIDAETTLSYTKIYAPIDGVIGKSLYSNGNLITPQTGKMTNITMYAPIYVRFSISEVVLRRDFGGLKGIRENTLVRLQLADKTLAKETASVAWVDNQIHASTNTITLWAVFQNKNQELIPGGFATVLLINKNSQKKPAVRPSALLTGKDGYSVYVIGKDGRVMERRVKIGRTTPDGFQIITSGLTGDELIVVDGTHKIKPGDKPALKQNMR